MWARIASTALIGAFYAFSKPPVTSLQSCVKNLTQLGASVTVGTGLPRYRILKLERILCQL